VYITKEEERAREMDMNNWNLGKYIAYSYNDPKKYPKKPFLHKEQKESIGRIMSNEEMDRMMKYNTIKLGGKIHGRSK
jgi:hypothetical protein